MLAKRAVQVALVGQRVDQAALAGQVAGLGGQVLSRLRGCVVKAPGPEIDLGEVGADVDGGRVEADGPADGGDRLVVAAQGSEVETVTVQRPCGARLQLEGAAERLARRRPVGAEVEEDVGERQLALGEVGVELDGPACRRLGRRCDLRGRMGEDQL